MPCCKPSASFLCSVFGKWTQFSAMENCACERWDRQMPRKIGLPIAGNVALIRLSCLKISIVTWRTIQSRRTIDVKYTRYRSHRSLFRLFSTGLLSSRRSQFCFVETKFETFVSYFCSLRVVKLTGKFETEWYLITKRDKTLHR